MVSIRGPKSALSDFIKEHGIETINKPKNKENDEQITIPITKSKQKKIKTMKFELPVEIVNLEINETDSFKIVYENVFNGFEILFKDDKELIEFSKYLSRKRKICFKHFEMILKFSGNKFHFYDCSTLKNEDFLILEDHMHKFTELELHFCGQLESQIISKLLKKAKNLKKLAITGGFLLQDFYLPERLEQLNVDDCSRINDTFIKRLNSNYKHLKMLGLKGCTAISGDILPKSSIEHLNVSKTNCKLDFFTYLKPLKVLSLDISECPNLFRPGKDDDSTKFLKSFINLQYLNISGLSTIKFLPKLISLKSLNISCCFQFEFKQISTIKTLESLECARINVLEEDLLLLQNLKNLKFLNISWNKNFTDKVCLFILDNLIYLKEIHMFGCFNITTKIGQIAWERKDKIKIIGSQSETNYLLNNQ